MKKHLLKTLLLGVITLIATGAWAQTVTTYDFEDGNALFTADSRITASVVEGTQTIYDQDFTLNGKAVSFKGANNAQNGYCFAHYDFSSLCDQAAKVKVEFETVLGNGARSIISVGDASVRGNTGNSSKTTYSNKGAIFRVGTDKSNSFVNGNTVGNSSVVSQKWLKVTIEVDEDAKKYTYSIVNKATEEVLFSNGEEPVAFYSSDATNCTQIDMFGYINNSQMGLIDNLIITVTKDEREQANYTVNFLDSSNNPIKEAVTRSGAVGDGIILLPADLEPLWNAEHTQKYIYQSDDSEGKTISAAGTTVVNIIYRDAATYSYTVLSSLGATLATGSGFEGESLRVGYPRYQLDGTDLYMASVDNKEYRTTVNLTEDNVSKTVAYTQQEGKVAAFYTEAEDIAGITVATNDNIPVRASNALAATTTEDVTITTLAPGKYILHVGIFTSKSSYSDLTVNFGVGEETFAANFGAVNLNEVASEEYTLAAPTAISYLASSSANAQFDYIWIEKTGEVEVVPVGNKTIALNPGPWAVDGAIFAAYAWNNDGDAWFPFLEVSGVYGTQIPENYTQIILVRLKPATAEGFSIENNGLNWTNKWNQTEDIDFTAIAEGTVFTITGWGDDKSPYETGEYGTPNTYTATFVTNFGWADVYAYAWTGEGESKVEQLGAWPGTKLTAVQDGIYALAFQAENAPEKIIFNNGIVEGDNKAQTPDLDFVNGKTYTFIKELEEFKVAIAQAVELNKQLNDADLAAAIGAANEAVNAETPNVDDIKTAAANLNAAVITAAKKALQDGITKAETFNAQVNNADLATAINTAKSAAEGNDVTAILAAAQNLKAALIPVAKTALQGVLTTFNELVESNALIKTYLATDADTQAALAAAAQAAEGNDLDEIMSAFDGLGNVAKKYAPMYITYAKTITTDGKVGGDDLKAAIEAAEAVINNAEATPLQLIAAMKSLKTAIDTFNAANAAAQDELSKAKKTLEDAISLATSLNAQINDADLAAAIATAQAALTAADATKDSCTEAAQTLKAAATAAVRSALQKAVILVTQMNEAELNEVLTAANGVLANAEATAQELAAALQNLVTAATPYAKTALAQGIEMAEELVANAGTLEIEISEEFTAAIEAAKTVKANEEATIQEIAAALTTLMDAALQPAKDALNQVLVYAAKINADETLTAALVEAKAVADNPDATVLQIAEVMKKVMDAAVEPAKAMLLKTIELAEMLHSETLAPIIAQAKVVAESDATLVQLVTCLKTLAEASMPEALSLLNTAKAYLATFDGAAATALKDDFDKLTADIEAEDITAIKSDISTLFVKGDPYIKSAIDKLEGYAAEIDNETLNADIAAVKDAYNKKDFGGLFAAVKTFEADFCTVAANYLVEVKAIDTTGKEGVEALNAAILALEEELKAETPKLMAVAAATRNLVLQVKAFIEQNVVYTVAGNASFFGETAWAVTEANAMARRADGTLAKTYEGVELTQDYVIEYKIVRTDIYGDKWIPEGDNLNYKVWEGDGKYNVTFTYNPVTGEAACDLKKQAEEPVLEEKEFAATFKNDADPAWEAVYAYTWTGDGDAKVEQLGAWPGTPLTANEAGLFVVSGKNATLPEFIIFHNNAGTQTADLAFEEGKEYSYMGVHEFAYQKYLVKNIASGMFWSQANNWGTKASLVPNAEYLKLVPVVGEGKYNIESQVNNGGTSYYFNGDFMDSSDKAVVTVTKVAEGQYTIDKDGAYFGWDGTSTVLGKELAADSENALWSIVSLTDAKAAMATATADAPVDATFLVEDHNFGRNNRYSNNWEGTGLKKGGDNSNLNTESYMAAFDLSQTLNEVPNGVYEVKAQAAVTYHDNREIKEYNGEGAPVIYANAETSDFIEMMAGDKLQSQAKMSAQFSAGEYQVEPVFVQVTDGTLKIGAKCERADIWAVWDNFTLAYYGADVTIDQVKNAAILAEMQELKAKAEDLAKDMEVAAIKEALEAAVAQAAAAEGADAINAAIEALKAALDPAEAINIAKNVLPKMKQLTETTNVYTQEAYDEYYGQWYQKYEAGTLTKAEASALQDPFVVTGWHASITVDNFLLSAWDTEADKFQGYYINSWSTEGENDGSNFKVPFFEYWTGDGDSLGERTLTATMNGLTPGWYDVTALVRVRAKNGYTAPAYGIKMQANNGDMTNVAAGEQVGESQFYLAQFTAKGEVAEDGVLKIKFIVAADNNISWLSFQNVNYAPGEAAELAQGDVNGDNEVTTSDAVATVDFVLEKSVPTEAQKKAADVNKSGDLTVADAKAIVNLALELPVEEAMAAARMDAGVNYLTLNGQVLNLTNTAAFAGFQMDVTLAEGAQFNGVKLAERAAGLTVDYNRVGENTWRIVALALQNSTISGNDGALLTLDIMGNSTVEVSNIEFADAAARAYRIGFNGEATGIRNVNIDADADIYNVNGVRTNTVSKGMNILRNANGEVKKMFVK